MIYILHHNDPDGWCSAAILYKHLVDRKHYFDEDIILHEVNYNHTDEAIMSVFKGVSNRDLLYVVDFSFKEHIWSKLESMFTSKNITWIDHHKTALEAPGFWHCYHGLRDDGADAACLLTWKYIYNETCLQPIPEVVKLVSDYDTWQFKDPRSESLVAALSKIAGIPNSENWGKLLEDHKLTLDYIIDKGREMLEYRREDNYKYVKALGYVVDFKGYKCLVCNKGMTNSKLFEILGDDILKNFQITAPFYYDGTNYTVSLYSKTVDVSVLAKEMGGGGHPGASGFVTKVYPFTETVYTLKEFLKEKKEG